MLKIFKRNLSFKLRSENVDVFNDKDLKNILFLLAKGTWYSLNVYFFLYFFLYFLATEMHFILKICFKNDKYQSNKKFKLKKLLFKFKSAIKADRFNLCLSKKAEFIVSEFNDIKNKLKKDLFKIFKAYNFFPSKRKKQDNFKRCLFCLKKLFKLNLILKNEACDI